MKYWNLVYSVIKQSWKNDTNFYLFLVVYQYVNRNSYFSMEK